MDSAKLDVYTSINVIAMVLMVVFGVYRYANKSHEPINNMNWIVLGLGVSIFSLIILRQWNGFLKLDENEKKLVLPGCTDSERNCLISCEDSIEILWLITTIPLDDSIITTSTGSHTDSSVQHVGHYTPVAYNDQSQECIKQIIDEIPVLSNQCWIVPPKKRFGLYRLDLKCYYIRASFNTCAVDLNVNDGKNWVSLKPLNRAMEAGCRFLDFEICAHQKEPCVVIFSDKISILRKSSYNHLPLSTVLKRIKERAFQSHYVGNHKDPLIIHLRIRTKIKSVIVKIGHELREHLGEYMMPVEHLIGLGMVEANGTELTTVTNFHSPFNVPMINMKSRKTIIIVLHNYTTLNAFKHGYKRYIQSCLGDIYTAFDHGQPVYHAWSSSSKPGAHPNGDLLIIGDKTTQTSDQNDDAVNSMIMMCPPLTDNHLTISTPTCDGDSPSCPSSESTEYKHQCGLLNQSVSLMKHSAPDEGVVIFKPNILPLHIESLWKNNKNLLQDWDNFFKSKIRNTFLGNPEATAMPYGRTDIEDQPKKVGLKQKLYKRIRNAHHPASISPSHTGARSVSAASLGATMLGSLVPPTRGSSAP